MKKILLTIWQLPQCIVAWVLLLFFSVWKETEYKGIRVIYSKQMQGGISLGRYIILDDWYWASDVTHTHEHEYGHTRQSLMLGWLYLIVIGLPSLIWAMLYGWIIPRTHNGYYKFYTEKWADKLGGVIRD